MDRDDEGVLEAARAIRPYLTDLVGSPDAAAELDRQLADELGRVPVPSASARRLRILLEQHEDNAWFLGRVPAERAGLPASLSSARRSHPRHRIPPEDVMPIAAVEYNCPVCRNYVWYLPDVGTLLPVARPTTC